MSAQDTSDYGDFIASEDEDEVEAEAEPRGRYREGLYYPIRIGDVLDNRYHIRHKLGWGGFSTVWLAYDAEGDRAVALKVLTPGSGQAECDIGNTILGAVRDPSRLVTHRAAFYLPGVDGTRHMVLVYPVRGPNLRATLHEGLAPAIRMAAAKQLLWTLKDLHEAGIIHKDLSTSNVMWHIDPVDRWTRADLYQRFGRPRKARLPEARGRPGELVEPVRVPVDMIGLPVYLGDFGISFRSADAIEATVQTPIAFCAPERYHGTVPSFASDMWGYTTILASLYLGGNAIPCEGARCRSQLVAMMGPFPESWKDLYSGGSASIDWWYDHTGHAGRPDWPWKGLEEKTARFRPETSEAERRHFLSVVRRGWSYVPEQRPTAAELLEDPSFGALMALYGV